jgi:hypothetical protein
MSAFNHDIIQQIAALHAHNVCSYLRGRLNARVVERLAPANDGHGLTRYRLVFRARGASANDKTGHREWTGTLPEICREYGLDIGRVVEQCR